MVKVTTALLLVLAGPEPVGVRIAGRIAPDAAFTDGPTEARRDDRAELVVIGVAREGRRRVYLVDDAIAPLVLDGRKVRPEERRPWPAEAQVRWSRVEPHAWRQDGVPAANGATTRYHSNVSTEPGTFGKWLGYDQIVYFETPLGEWSGDAAARRRPASASSDADPTDLGTMRYKVEARLGEGPVLATPGADAVDQYGIEPRVHRVSIRADDTYIGYVTAYFRVPEVFGSAGPGRNHQTERFTGADCADVLTGALRRMGRTDVQHTHVAGLTRYAQPLTASILLDAEGRPPEPITGVQLGDVIRIDYGGSLTGHTPRAFDHVAALYEDRSDPEGPHRGGPDGALDGFDLVAHMGHPHLVVEPLKRQCPARIDVLRWRAR